jgi:RNA polymerase sigma-B factor
MPPGKDTRTAGQTSRPCVPADPRHDRDEYAELTPLFDQLTDHSLTDAHRRQIRARLVTGHLPLAQHIAWRFRGRGQPAEDLVQVATLGLINAVDRFDPNHGSNFLAFAVPTITGEVRRYFRDATWAVRVPRRLKELHTDVNTATTALAQQFGRAPRPSELAAELRLPIEEIHEGIHTGFAYRCDTFDGETGDNGFVLADRQPGTDDHDFDVVEDREVLYPALATLPEREQAIVAMRFFGDMTQSQIADRIGISQMHVSRLLAGSLARLRRTIKGRPGQARTATRRPSAARPRASSVGE